MRVHSSCATGDIFGSMRCECGEQLHEGYAPHRPKKAKGYRLPEPRKGRGIGLMEDESIQAQRGMVLDTVGLELAFRPSSG